MTVNNSLTTSYDHPIILFDGVCNLCNSSVRLIIRIDKKKIFRFSSLQSETGISILEIIKKESSISDSMVLITRDAHFTSSTAILMITKMLGIPWSLFYIFTIIPKSKRDQIYQWIAKNRYHWFGKKDQCIIPSPDLSDRFM